MSEAREDEVEVFECEKVVNKVTMLCILSVFPRLQSHMAKLGDITSLETAMGQKQVIVIIITLGQSWKKYNKDWEEVVGAL